MGFYLHQNVNRFRGKGVLLRLGSREKPFTIVPINDRRVVSISGQYTAGRLSMGVTNHSEQGFVLVLPIDIPTRVEYLMAAVFRVSLRKHHQFNISRVSFQLAKPVK